MTKYLILINARASVTNTSLAWSKTSFAVTLLRLSSGMTKAFIWFIIISLNITIIVAALVPWIQCNPIARTWDFTVAGPEACWAPGIGPKVWIGLGGLCSPPLYEKLCRADTNSWFQRIMRSWTLLWPSYHGYTSTGDS